MNTDVARDGERTRGVRAALSLAPVYRLAQNAVGADRFRSALTQEYLRVVPGDRILDLGCGTADILDHLPTTDYIGFDPSERYVTDARSRFGDRGRFVTSLDDATELQVDRTLAIAIGVLHHVDDRSAASMIELAASSLEPGGRMVTVDPTIVDGQHWAAKFLASQDRGQHVRSPEGTAELFSAFDLVKVSVRHDLLRMPYSHVIVEASQPRHPR